MNTSTHSSKRTTRTSSKSNKQTKSETTNYDKSNSPKPSTNKKSNNNKSSTKSKTTTTNKRTHKGKGNPSNADRSPVRTRSGTSIQTTVKNLFNSPSIYSNSKQSIQNNINNITSSIQTFNVDTIGITQESSKEASSPIAKAIKWTQNKFTTSGIESEDESQNSNEVNNKNEEEIRFKSPLKAPPLLQDLEMASSTSPSMYEPTPAHSNTTKGTKEQNHDNMGSPSIDTNITTGKQNKNQQMSPATITSTNTSPPYKKPNNNNSPSDVAMASMEKLYEKMCGKAYKRMVDEGSNDNSNQGSNENSNENSNDNPESYSGLNKFQG